MLEWRAFKASQLCSHCGRPWAIHEDEVPDDYETGYLICPAAEQVTKARASYATSPAGEAETERVKNGGPDPREWRQWIHWSAALGPPEFAPLD